MTIVAVRATTQLPSARPTGQVGAVQIVGTVSASTPTWHGDRVQATSTSALASIWHPTGYAQRDEAYAAADQLVQQNPGTSTFVPGVGVFHDEAGYQVGLLGSRGMTAGEVVGEPVNLRPGAALFADAKTGTTVTTKLSVEREASGMEAILGSGVPRIDFGSTTPAWSELNHVQQVSTETR